MSNWAKKLNDPRKRVNIVKQVNRRLPWLKVVLAVIFIGTGSITFAAWQIWQSSPNAQLEDTVAGETETLAGDAPEPETAKDDVEVYSVLPALENRTKKEIVERAKVRVLQGRKRIIATGTPMVALTFDDGPSGITTPRLLDVLREKQAVATFFMLGKMARANPAVVKRAASEGHEVASHTMYHQNLIRISEGSIRADVGEANQVFVNILGAKPALTRVPYGNANTTVKRMVGTPLINWTVDTNDWRKESKANPRKIFDTAIYNAFDGAIILMHDIYPTTVDQVGPIIDELRARGYELVTVSEMAQARGITMQPGVEYSSFRP